MRVAVIIPARFQSSRLPGKPLQQVGGQSVLAHTIQNMQEAGYPIWVATDDERIAQEAARYGASPMIIEEDVSSGTERVALAMRQIQQDVDVVVNVQVDEIGFKADHLHQLVHLFNVPEVQIATPITPIRRKDELFNPNVVKVVRRRDGAALLFSRQAIPYQWLDVDQWVHAFTYYRHIGVYAFRPRILQQLYHLPPTPLEQAERLEQLRWMEHGYDIYTVEIDVHLPAIDTHQDIIEAEELLGNDVQVSGPAH